MSGEAGSQRAKILRKIAVGDFMRFTGIVRPEEFRTVTRAHVIAWRDDLQRRGLQGPTRRNRLAALSSLFEYLCDKNAIPHNPVKGIKRPKAESGEGTHADNRRSPGAPASGGAQVGNPQGKARPVGRNVGAEHPPRQPPARHRHPQ